MQAGTVIWAGDCSEQAGLLYGEEIVQCRLELINCEMSVSCWRSMGSFIIILNILLFLLEPKNFTIFPNYIWPHLICSYN